MNTAKTDLNILQSFHTPNLIYLLLIVNDIRQNPVDLTFANDLRKPG